MRNLVMILLIAVTIGAVTIGAALPAAAQVVLGNGVRAFGIMTPIVNNNAYGHWRRCADLTGMCGVGVG